jgi:hypothetical protein
MVDGRFDLPRTLARLEVSISTETPVPNLRSDLLPRVTDIEAEDGSKIHNRKSD